MMVNLHPHVAGVCRRGMFESEGNQKAKDT